MPRFRMVAPAGLLAPQPVPSGVIVRNTDPGVDDEALATLIVLAYTGTSESEPDDDEEFARWKSAEYGPPMFDASFVALDASTGTPVGATLICIHEDCPLLAHVVVDTARKRGGVARALIDRSRLALVISGWRDLHLAVSAENRPALRTYARLGFALYADDAKITPGGVEYRDDSLGVIEAKFDDCIPELALPGFCGIGGEKLPTQLTDLNFACRILALVTGHRSGEARVPLDASSFEATIALLRPTATINDKYRTLVDDWEGFRTDSQLFVRFAVRPV